MLLAGSTNQEKGLLDSEIRNPKLGSILEQKQVRFPA
jgi:hypothetical protein